MEKGMKKRWISLYVENQVGVLSKISGLFSGKCYNLDSLTVGTTEDPTVSRMTIATVSDDETFEQIKKQLNRMVEVIKVIDFTDIFIRKNSQKAKPDVHFLYCAGSISDDYYLRYGGYVYSQPSYQDTDRNGKLAYWSTKYYG